jgi:hypothetical protein
MFISTSSSSYPIQIAPGGTSVLQIDSTGGFFGDDKYFRFGSSYPHYRMIYDSTANEFKLTQYTSSGGVIAKDLFTFDDTNGNVHMPRDNQKLYRGADDDASDYFDGTNWNFDLTSGDFIFSGGNVGIGTTSPRAELDTNGVIRAVGGSYTAVPGAGSDTKTDVGMVIPAGMSYSSEWNGYIRNLIKWDSDDRDIDIGQTGTNLITNINLIAGSGGNIRIPRDNSKLLLGAGDDASIYYDGTNFIVNPKEVGSGILDVSGTLQTDGYNAVDGTSALAGTKVYYVSDTSGGSPTRKLTFKDGLLVSET